MPTITPITVLLTIAVSVTVQAQGPMGPQQPSFPTLRDSQWVRVAGLQFGRTEGRLLTQGQSELVLTGGSGPVRVPVTTVDSLWTRRRSTGVGALVGAILFGGLGALAATSSALEENAGSARSTVALAGIGALAGSLIGAVIGHGIPTWQRRYP